MSLRERLHPESRSRRILRVSKALGESGLEGAGVALVGTAAANGNVILGGALGIVVAGLEVRRKLKR